MPVCPNCGNQAADTAIFCDQCGTKMPTAEAAVPTETLAVAEPAGGIPADIIACPACGAENVPGEVFCDACGEPLETPAPTVTEAAAGEPAVDTVVAEETDVAVEVEIVVEAEPEAEPEPVIEGEPVIIEAEIEEPLVEMAAAPDQETYCPVCGAAIHAKDTFCGNCGASLSETPEEEWEEAPIMEEPVIEDETVQEIVFEEDPIEVAPVVEELVIEEVPVEVVPVEELIIEEVPTEVVPVEELIVEEVPVEVVPVEELVIEQEPVAAATAQEQELACPVCSANVLPDQTFCASCGAALHPATAATPAPAAPTAPAGPYLSIVASGAHIPLVEQPELLIGREDDISGIYPDVDMTPHGGEAGGISRRHAKLIYDQGAWFIVDLDSTNGTCVNQVEVTPKTRVTLKDGDAVSLGDVEAAFHLGG
jgi:predicted amidophosphoribosyltransferase